MFIRILCGKYDEQKLPDITFELVDMTPETPADPETTPEEIPEAAAKPETAPEETPRPSRKRKPRPNRSPETLAEPEKSDQRQRTRPMPELQPVRAVPVQARRARSHERCAIWASRSVAARKRPGVLHGHGRGHRA
ncbi:MAG: hypothetical protein ACLSHG_08600 [Oscillospiraceae bacterium]